LRVQELRKVAEAELGTVEAELEREAKEDNELRDKYGSEWTRPSSSALNSSLREKVAGSGPLLFCRLMNG
jgi:ALIX V-shaped domain binding to HIV